MLPIETPNAAPTGPPTAKPTAPPKILPITPPISSARTLSLISSLETAEAISNTSFPVSIAPNIIPTGPATLANLPRPKTLDIKLTTEPFTFVINPAFIPFIFVSNGAAAKATPPINPSRTLLINPCSSDSPSSGNLTSFGIANDLALTLFASILSSSC